MKISDLQIGDLFSFSKKGGVHMVSQVRNIFIEYKSYNDGKIRICFLDREKEIFKRENWDKIFEAKWFIK